MFINESSWDRIVRVVFGFGLLAAVFFGPQTPWGWLGLVLLATGTLGFCPLYRVLGLSTYVSSKKAPHATHA